MFADLSFLRLILKNCQQKSPSHPRLGLFHFHNSVSTTITASWAIHFREFRFTPVMIRKAAKLSHNDRLILESRLSELHRLKDPRSLNISKYHDSHFDHLKIYLSGRVSARVDYKLLADSNFKAEIIDIYKRKDSSKRARKS